MENAQGKEDAPGKIEAISIKRDRMRHKKIEKWLSDRSDGKLSEKRKRNVEAHLKRCAACRSYARDLARIHQESKGLEMPEVSPSYREEFVSRLKAGISSLPSEERKGTPLILRWKWALAAVSFIILIFFGLFLYLNQQEPVQEFYIFSFEDSFNRISQEIGSDPDLEELFNSLVLASLGEAISDSGEIVQPDLYENSLFWESFTEEEMKFLESEIKKNSE